MAYDVQGGDADFDVSPLQKAFLTLAARVDQCSKENAALRAEVAELRISKRLEALEQGLQELADSPRPGGLFWNQSTNGRDDGRIPAWAQAESNRSLYTSTSIRIASRTGQNTSNSGAAGGGPGSTSGAVMGSAGFIGNSGAGTPASDLAGAASELDASWLVQEVMLLRERLEAMERKSEALWHTREDEEALRSAVERLRVDIVSMQSNVEAAQATAASANALSERQATSTAENGMYVKDLQERLHALEMSAMKGNDERREMAAKYESSVGQIWDQLRHVEGSLAQRLTLAETSHVAALQEVDEAKEATNEVLQRVDDVKRHVSALEGKLESFNTQVAAAINPLHNALAAAGERLDGLAASKQDAAAAIKQADVELGVARAIDHADRRGDNLLKAIAGLEARLESLSDSTPNKGEVVLTADLEALLTEHAHELDAHLDALKREIIGSMGAKVDREELGALDSRTASRLDGLEGALLKGLRAISDKVSAALSEKLDLVKFNEFKLQVRAILADVEDRLRDWSPLAFGTKAQLGTDPLTTGAMGAPSCLCCDARVRSVRELKAMGFREDDRVFAPDRLPATDPLLPSIQGNRAATLGAHINARLIHRVATADARLRSTASLIESLPGSTPGTGGGGGGGTSGGSGTGGGGGTGAGSSSLVSTPGGGGMTGTISSAGGLAAAVDASSFAMLPLSQTREERLGSGSGSGMARVASARGMKVKVETVSGAIMKGQLPSRQGTPSVGGGGVGSRPVRSPVAAAATATGVSLHLAVGAAAVAAAVQGHEGSAMRPMSPWRSDTPGTDPGVGPLAVG